MGMTQLMPAILQHMLTLRVMIYIFCAEPQSLLNPACILKWLLLLEFCCQIKSKHLPGALMSSLPPASDMPIDKTLFGFISCRCSTTFPLHVSTNLLNGTRISCHLAFLHTSPIACPGTLGSVRQSRVSCTMRMNMLLCQHSAASS